MDYRNIIVSAYKVALGLPRNSPNKVCWKFSNQTSFGTKVVQVCDKYLCKSAALDKGRILNKTKFIWDQFNSDKVSINNIPLLVFRWPVVEPFFKFLSKSKIYPYFTFPFKENFRFTEFDLISEWKELRIAMTLIEFLIN